MPVERVEMSVSQFAELVGVEADRVIAVEKRGDTMILVLEPEVIHGDDGGILPPIAERREDRGWKESDRQSETDHGHDGHRQEKDRV